MLKFATTLTALILLLTLVFVVKQQNLRDHQHLTDYMHTASAPSISEEASPTTAPDGEPHVTKLPPTSDLSIDPSKFGSSGFDLEREVGDIDG